MIDGCGQGPCSCPCHINDNVRHVAPCCNGAGNPLVYMEFIGGTYKVGDSFDVSELKRVTDAS